MKGAFKTRTQNLAIIFLFAFGGLVACASRPLQTEKILRERPSSLPASQMISNVPFIEQAAHECGPATLAMVMNWAGVIESMRR